VGNSLLGKNAPPLPLAGETRWQNDGCTSKIAHQFGRITAKLPIACAGAQVTTPLSDRLVVLNRLSVRSEQAKVGDLQDFTES
jgi:hypothetical protein